MTNAKRILCTALAAVMLLSATLLAGCSAPKLTIGGTAKTAATIGDTKISTGEYLAYLYNSFYNVYYGQGLSQYAQYYDLWAQTFPYGEGDDAEKLELGEYIKRSTQDSIVRQVALKQMLKNENLSWNTEDEATIDEQLKELKDESYLSLGFSNEHFIEAYKNLNLNETSLFYGLYGEGGSRAVSEADRRAYFEKNFVSYKMISIGMTDTNGAELDEAGQKEITDKLESYLAQYKAEGSFEAVVDAYNKSTASDASSVTASTDEDNRINVDATQASDKQLIEAVHSVDVGQAKVVTYKAGGSTLTAALILRLDPQQPDSVFTDSTEAILYGMKFEEFNTEVEKAVAALKVSFKKSVVKKCDPQNFVAVG